jgi:hypothetical protein
MQVKIQSAANIPPGDAEKLREKGLDVKINNNGGMDLVSNNQHLVPKTVTGFMDLRTGDFVVIVTDPQSPEHRKTTIEFWRRE